MSMYWIKK